MTTAKKTIKSQAWTLYDRIVHEALAGSDSPWTADEKGALSYAPDLETLRLLLRVPAYLGSTSTSGIPALAIDVWVAHELRRAGFEPDAVWPRNPMYHESCPARSGS